MTGVPSLTTPRFTMRPLRRTDAAALFPTLSDPHQCRYLSREAFADEAELHSWLADPDWPGRTWIAEDAAGVAGRFVAMPAHEEGVIEVGYITCAHRQREGVARECMAALINHLFTAPIGEGPTEQGTARKLIAVVDCENPASARTAERLGFVREAHFREHETTHEGLRDVWVYGLLAREW
ncbi:GNAT family N-acetyltransferase [Erythrobacter rubeus]|uniref:GNAT family N-acetyltransferase n=1 Tax=Erythrobacter rubeus TaxID=2760803 RepID=A0ABR8KPM3_9SPHN|nr:GNAT family protein [Erythrobacter rubeus]MBD2841410.1 GNAT family N-acetyltransferase [Erythrobacter rubeus]